MPTVPTAHFASARSDLIVVEQTATPVFSNGRQIKVEPGRYHKFAEHRCVVQGKASIEFMRERAHAHDTPGIWEMNASDVPEITELLAELATADIDRVREIRRNEEGTAARMVILQTCDAVLQRAGVSERRPGEKATVTG